ncbi:hypothetical protein KZP23_17835 [Echinicola marina]|uniref:hypothetical protein n=1 Tax=Echinicola marina TaxID=2859768 RepID=UPI001CF6EF09|nr:hypothetical protein [Echinicola marina]UCS92534.1 hypothetical protein KZP23_17835 [Echinicola marina]
MKVSTVFKPLLKISLYHNYFLNDGKDEFVGMVDDKKQEQLKTYHWNSFFDISPSNATLELLQGHHITVKSYADHLLLALKVDPTDEQIPFIEFLGDEELIFKFKVRDPFFWNYTHLPFTGEEILYFTNKEPNLSAPFDFEPLHKAQENKVINSNFLFSGENKKELLEQTQLEDNAPTGILRLFIQADNVGNSVLQQNGKLKNQLPHFKIHFDNQKTIWKYIHHKGAFETETKKVQPLTHYGFVHLESPTDFKSNVPDLADYKFPNPNPLHIKSIGNKLYSEIFI